MCSIEERFREGASGGTGSDGANKRLGIKMATSKPGCPCIGCDIYI